MGLRFRKSVTLCKGVKLNFNKSGTSITVGRKGYHKTISSSGKITTTIGIPGTGIYYTDTKQVEKKCNVSESKKNPVQKNGSNSGKVVEKMISAKKVEIEREAQSVLLGQSFQDEHYSQYLNLELLHKNYKFQHIKENSVDIKEKELAEKEISWDYNKYEKNKNAAYDIDMDDLLWTDLITVHNPDIVIEQKISDVSQKNTLTYFDAEMIKEIYTSCDQSILWKDIKLGVGFIDLFMNQETWDYCKDIADKIIDKDIDTYLKAIENLKPVDDLLLYGGEFEFGTDDGHYMEAEFKFFPEEVLEEGKNSELLGDYILAVSLRVARDIMATLPIDVMIVHVVIESVTVLSVAFERKVLEKIDFRNMQLIQITTQVPMRLSADGKEVERISFDTYKNVPILKVPEKIIKDVVEYEKSTFSEVDEVLVSHRREEELIIRAWNNYGMSIFNENHMQELRQEFEANHIEFREMFVLSSLHSIAGYYWEDTDAYKEVKLQSQNDFKSTHVNSSTGRIEHVRGHYRYRNGHIEYVRAHYRHK